MKHEVTESETEKANNGLIILRMMDLLEVDTLTAKVNPTESQRQELTELKDKLREIVK